MTYVLRILKNQWKEGIYQYCELIKTLRQKDNFEDSEIDDFQTKADNLYRNWIKLHGINGVTNYFHMIGSGHILYYLVK